MQTKVTTAYKTNLDDLCFGYWEPLGDNDGQVIYLKDDSKPEDIQKAAEYLGVSPKLIDALMMFSGDIRDDLRVDLVDIWKRLDKVEQKLSQ